MVLVEYTLRKLVQPWIRMWVRQGIPGTEMLRTIRSIFGYAYRLEDFYADIRKYRQALEKISEVLTTPKYQRFKDDLYTKNELLAKKYAHDVNIRYFDPESKEIRETRRRVYSSKKLTRGEAERTAERLFKESPDKEGFSFIDAEIDELYYNPEL